VIEQIKLNEAEQIMGLEKKKRKVILLTYVEAFLQFACYTVRVFAVHQIR
jgi:hypothetical protein